MDEDELLAGEKKEERKIAPRRKGELRNIE